jgi:hypothetical protein
MMGNAESGQCEAKVEVVRREIDRADDKETRDRRVHCLWLKGCLSGQARFLW